MNRRGFLATPGVVALAAEAPPVDPRAAMLDYIQQVIGECLADVACAPVVVLPATVERIFLTITVGETVEIEGIVSECNRAG